MHPISYRYFPKLISTQFAHACLLSYIYIAIAHVVDLEIIKRVSVHLTKLCRVYNAVTMQEPCKLLILNI